MRPLVYVAVQQPRPGPAHPRDFGARFANLLKQLLILSVHSRFIGWLGCNIADILAKLMACSKPFDLVPFRAAAHVLWSTTDRMRIDMFFAREKYGTVS